MKQKIIMPLAVAALLISGRASAQMAVHDPGTFAGMMANFKLQYAKAVEAVVQATKGVEVATETLSIAQDAYAGVDYLVTMTPEKLGNDVLSLARSYSGTAKGVNSGEVLYRSIEGLTKQGINGGTFDLSTPMMLYDRSTGAWRKVKGLGTATPEDVALERSAVRAEGVDMSKRRINDDDVDTSDVVRVVRGDSVDHRIIERESKYRKGFNRAAEQAYGRYEDMVRMSKSKSKEARNLMAPTYTTAQMTSLTVQQLAILNKQIAEQRSWRAIEETERLNAKEKANLSNHKATQFIDERVKKLTEKKVPVRTELQGFTE